MKTIMIFGASNGVGEKLAHQAEEKGIKVIAITRNPDAIKSTEFVKVKKADVLEADQVNAVMQDCDAVYVTLGAPPTDKNMVRAKGTQNIIDAMKHSGSSNRLICLSSIGVGNSKEMVSEAFKSNLIDGVLKHAFMDHEAQEKEVHNSGLNYTIVRPTNLTDGPIEPYTTGTEINQQVSGNISRASVADFMLDLLQNPAYDSKSVWINRKDLT